VYLVAPSLDQEQMHPITIASSPRSSASRFTLLVKELGDWTHELAGYIEQCALSTPQQPPDFRIDGFYGSSLAIYQQYPVVCLLGGGIGATPLFAILEDILAVRSSGQSLKQQRVFVTFAFRELSLLEHIHPILVQLQRSGQHGAGFTLDLRLTIEPSDDDLARVVPTPTDHYQPCEIGDHKSTAQAFAAPLHSRATRTVVYAVIFAGMTAITIWLEAGGGLIIRWTGHSSYWPLQRVIEVFCLGFVARTAVLAVYLEKRASQTDETTPVSSVNPQIDNEGARLSRHAGASTMRIRDMIALHNVKYGRPDVHKLLKAVRNEVRRHSSSNSTVSAGVFMSGPTPMKRQAECTITDLGVGYFDIHEEEFEL